MGKEMACSKCFSAEQYQTVYLSAYEVLVPRPDLAIKNWKNFVQSNNSLAENFVTQHLIGDDHFDLLATASWREFCLIQMKRQ
jgi:hypothetical protein